MRALRPFAVLVLALVLSGCFQTQTLLRLNADGSGTIEETVLMNTSFAMMALLGGSELGMERDEGKPYAIAQLEAHAAEMGARFVGVEDQDILFGEGYVATYAFDDVNALRLTSDPSSFLPDEIQESAEMPEEQPLTFAYRDGTLTITMPRPDEGAMEETLFEEEFEEPDAETERIYVDPKKQGGTSEMDFDTGSGPSEDEAMMAVFKDMRFTLRIELPQAPAQTNASYVDGRTLTLFDMDFSALADNPEAFDQLQEIAPNGPPDFATAMSALSSMPGFAFETEETVTVRLR